MMNESERAESSELEEMLVASAEKVFFPYTVTIVAICGHALAFIFDVTMCDGL